MRKLPMNPSQFLPTKIENIAKLYGDKYYFFFKGMYWGYKESEYNMYVEDKARVIKPLMTQEQLDTLRELYRTKKGARDMSWISWGIINRKDRPLERMTFTSAEILISKLSKLDNK